ncbi:MAG: recombinase family protein [Acidobacteriota bacterium]
MTSKAENHRIETRHVPRPVRCAVYTRKSTDEGLNMDFNSLDAQREAAEAYVASQKHEGWTCLPERYDDGGFSGGNMDRPALKRLLDDIDAGQADCLVVYKVDRLSRSLLDFARIMEVLERHKVSFVSVTQQFNTAHSMGRLTLNVLLSFAQFEREIIAERTRDKMSAARRKGKWTGGMPVLGYDIDPQGGKLIVNEFEASRVRAIFEVYLKWESLTEAAKEINGRGWTTKAWITKEGRRREGCPFHKGNLRDLLAKVIYLGKVNHKGKIYDGEHDAIVDEEVWRRAQEVLRRNKRNGGKDVRNKYGALLRGLLQCVPCGAAMTHAYTARGPNKRYRYYVCTKAQKQGWDSCPSKSIPANEIERFVVERIRAIGRDPGLVAEVLDQVRTQEAKQREGLVTERKGLEHELNRLNGQVRRITEQGDLNGNLDRLAALQDRIRAAQQRVIEIREEMIKAGRRKVDEGEFVSALKSFEPVWDALSPREQSRMIRLLIERVGYDGREADAGDHISARRNQDPSIRGKCRRGGNRMISTDYSEEALPTEGPGGLTLECQIHFQKGRRGRKIIRKRRTAFLPDQPTGKVPRVSRLMALAIKMDEPVRTGEVRDYADLARLGHVSRARITQIMNLLNLAPEIQEEILFLPSTFAGSDAVSERDLRAIASEVNWKKQRLMWIEGEPPSVQRSRSTCCPVTQLIYRHRTVHSENPTSTET